MSDMLQIGASGVRSYQTALSVVSDNIANATTDGYVRRSAVMREVVGGGASTLLTQGVKTGNGVLVAGVSRSVDALKTAAARNAGADLAKTEAGATWLTRIQSALTDDKLGDRVTGFFTAATTLAADPTSTSARAAMLEQAGSTAAAFTAAGRSLDAAAIDLDATADQAVQTLDSLATGLAKVNEGLGRTQSGTSAAAALADQRDSLLEQMSALADVSSTTDSLGRATVKLGGAGGATIVSGTDAGHVTYSRNTGTGAVSLTVHMLGQASALTPNGGALAGLVDGAQRIQAATTSLDDLATRFTSAVNTVQTSGRDLDGNPGQLLFATGSAPTEISVALTDPRGIAAAGASGGTRDASNLDALQAARTAGGFETGFTAQVSDVAAAISQRQIVADAQTAIHDGAVSARDAVSGVNLDTEAVDLLRFQQAYSASSRVIQVARETFQSLIAIN